MLTNLFILAYLFTNLFLLTYQFVLAYIYIYNGLITQSTLASEQNLVVVGCGFKSHSNQHFIATSKNSSVVNTIFICWFSLNSCDCLWIYIYIFQVQTDRPVEAMLLQTRWISDWTSDKSFSWKKWGHQEFVWLLKQFVAPVPW